jgi:hypothetical protein
MGSKRISFPATVGDTFTSLIHTAQLHGKNADGCSSRIALEKLSDSDCRPVGRAVGARGRADLLVDRNPSADDV